MSLDDFMRLMNFTPDDLTANRQGQLSNAQQRYLQALQGRLLRIGIGGFFSLALIATILLFLGQQSASLIWNIIGTLFILINGIFIGRIARQWLRLDTDLRSAQIEVLSGTVERIIRPYGQVHNYLLRVNGQDIAVQKEVFKRFQHQHAYTIYRTRHTQIVLAAEAQTPTD